MNKFIAEEIYELGGDVTEPEWEWLLKNGPHGNDFSWSQTRKEPSGYVGVEHLQRIIDSKIKNDQNFKQKIRQIVNIALKSTSSEVVRRGIQVASLVGGREELNKIHQLTNSTHESVVKDAKASVFLLKREVTH